MRQKLLTISENTFDKLYHVWESKANQKILGTIFVGAFLSSIFLIWLKNIGLFPNNWKIPTNYFFAVEVAFTILLVVEVASMVFVLAHSVSDSVSKQFEIFSLILLRNAFKEFDHFQIVELGKNFTPVYHMFADALGGLVIFIIIIVFTKIKLHKKITEDADAQQRFNSVKKFVALTMIISFIAIGVDDLFRFLTNSDPFNFFTNFYTLLIFTDILIVLISLRYSQSYLVVFRNSAFALATVMIRIALTTPPYFDVLIGLVSGIFVLSTSFAYNRYLKLEATSKKHDG